MDELTVKTSGKWAPNAIQKLSFICGLAYQALPVEMTRIRRGIDMKRSELNLLLIGLDGAILEVIGPLVEMGKVPHLGRIMAEELMAA